MGMYDSYYISRSFKCPNCGEKFNKKNDFQSKEGLCSLASYKLGDNLGSSRRYWDWYAFCWKCENVTFNCRVYINEYGIAYREVVGMIKKGNDCMIYVNDYEHKKQKRNK